MLPPTLDYTRKEAVLLSDADSYVMLSLRQGFKIQQSVIVARSIVTMPAGVCRSLGRQEMVLSQSLPSPLTAPQQP